MDGCLTALVDHWGGDRLGHADSRRRALKFRRLLEVGYVAEKYPTKEGDSGPIITCVRWS